MKLDLEALVKKAADKRRTLVGFVTERTFDGYGAFPGGDPRDFHPDPECSTEEERKAHSEACAQAKADERARQLDPAHTWDNLKEVPPEQVEAATVTETGYGHIARKMFGLGRYDDPHANEAGSAAMALEDVVLEMVGRIRALEGALLRHGEHDFLCAFRDGQRDHSKGYRSDEPDLDECTCGLRAALEGK